MRTHIPRIIVRMLGKCITFSFALFCVITGLTQTASAESVTGTVRCRSSLAPLPGIRVVLADAICPLYGCNPCSPGQALDTTVTDSVGQFKIDESVLPRYYFLVLNDIDFSPEGDYLPRSVRIDRESDQENQLYMLPMNSPVSVEGVVSKNLDSSSLAGIKVELHSVWYTGCMPSTAHDTVLLSGYTDADGRFSLELGSPSTSNHYIKVVDVDGTENGGVFQPDSSKRFNAYFDPIPNSFYLSIDPASGVSMHETTMEKSSIIPVVSRGSVSMQIPTSWNPGETSIVITNARGVTVDRVKAQHGKVVWNTTTVARGLYCLNLVLSDRKITVPFVLP